MKKWLMTILCCLMVVGLTACKNDNKPNSSSPTQSTSGQTDGTTPDNYDWLDNLD